MRLERPALGGMCPAFASGQTHKVTFELVFRLPNSRRSFIVDADVMSPPSQPTSRSALMTASPDARTRRASRRQRLGTRRLSAHAAGKHLNERAIDQLPLGVRYRQTGDTEPGNRGVAHHVDGGCQSNANRSPHDGSRPWNVAAWLVVQHQQTPPLTASVEA